MQQIRIAADRAVFDVVLLLAAGGVDGELNRFAAVGTHVVDGQIHDRVWRGRMCLDRCFLPKSELRFLSSQVVPSLAIRRFFDAS